MAKSLISLREDEDKRMVEQKLKHSSNNDSRFQTFNFRMEEVDGFRYRVLDAQRSITKTKIRNVRMSEIRIVKFSKSEGMPKKSTLCCIVSFLPMINTLLKSRIIFQSALHL